MVLSPLLPLILPRKACLFQQWIPSITDCFRASKLSHKYTIVEYHMMSHMMGHMMNHELLSKEGSLTSCACRMMQWSGTYFFIYLECYHCYHPTTIHSLLLHYSWQNVYYMEGSEPFPFKNLSFLAMPLRAIKLNTGN